MLPSPDMILEAVGYGVLLPAAVTALGLLLALRWAFAARGGDVLAVVAGLVAGLAALVATDQIPSRFHKPVDCWDWLPGLALLASAVSLDRLLFLTRPARAARPPVLLARWVVRVGFAALAGWLLVRTQSANVEPVEEWWPAALALAVTGLWGLDFLARRWPGAGLPVLLALVAFAAAGVMELSGFIRLSQMAGVLAAVLGGCALAGWRWRHAPVAEGAVPAFAVLVPGLLFGAWFNTFAQVPAASYLLVVAAPLLLALTALPPLAGLPGRPLALVRAGVVLLPLAAALALAARA